MNKGQPKTRQITLPPSGYQPPKAAKEKEHDMPKANAKIVRNAFFQPYTVKRGGVK